MSAARRALRRPHLTRRPTAPAAPEARTPSARRCRRGPNAQIVLAPPPTRRLGRRRPPPPRPLR
eukprot:186808-Chlamydomonas_euryale.AAC.1